MFTATLEFQVQATIILILNLSLIIPSRKVNSAQNGFLSVIVAPAASLHCRMTHNDGHYMSKEAMMCGGFAVLGRFLIHVREGRCVSAGKPRVEASRSIW